MKDLKSKVICPNCNSINIKKSLKNGEVACCYNCGKILYKDLSYFEQKIARNPLL